MHARATGDGQHIDAALMDSQVAVLANHWSAYLNAGVVPQRLGNAHATVVPYRDFRVADGDVIVAVGSDSQFLKLCRLLGRDDLAADDRLRSNAGRQTNRAWLEEELQQTLSAWRADDLLAAMAKEGVPGGPINRLDAVFAEPQVKARALVESCPNGAQPPLSLVRYPHLFSATPATVRRAPPRLGEHSREILGDDLGLDVDEIDRLIAKGVVA
jgi:crotonobetainyl-CoA:carnitine CoA-transferase CaiB-like acyl-CoA transferase